MANFAVGYDNVDLEACRSRGVVVTNTPDVLTNATAELAVALMLAAARHLGAGERLVRAGRWTGWDPAALLGRELSGTTVGIVGLGRIGLRVAELLRGFEPSLLYASPSARPDEESRLGLERVELDELVRRSDFVTLHAPSTPETRHLIDEALLARFKPGAVLVNTARGPLVDATALAAALREGRLAAAGLDVFEHEPQVEEELLALDNVVLLPHLGSATGTRAGRDGAVGGRERDRGTSGKAPAHARFAVGARLLRGRKRDGNNPETNVRAIWEKRPSGGLDIGGRMSHDARRGRSSPRNTGQRQRRIRLPHGEAARPQAPLRGLLLPLQHAVRPAGQEALPHLPPGPSRRPQAAAAALVRVPPGAPGGAVPVPAGARLIQPISNPPAALAAGGLCLPLDPARPTVSVSPCATIEARIANDAISNTSAASGTSDRRTSSANSIEATPFGPEPGDEQLDR